MASDRGFRCPECSAPADPGLSGNVEEGVSTSISARSAERVCVVGPDEEHAVTTLYFHTSEQVWKGEKDE